MVRGVAPKAQKATQVLGLPEVQWCLLKWAPLVALA